MPSTKMQLVLTILSLKAQLQQDLIKFNVTNGDDNNLVRNPKGNRIKESEPVGALEEFTKELSEDEDWKDIQRMGQMPFFSNVELMDLETDFFHLGSIFPMKSS